MVGEVVEMKLERHTGHFLVLERSGDNRPRAGQPGDVFLHLSRREVWLTPSEARKLAYELIAMASGSGESNGD
jgi:hypothetical protein